jgi:hypothetical protein
VLLSEVYNAPLGIKFHGAGTSARDCCTDAIIALIAKPGNASFVHFFVPIIVFGRRIDSASILQ